MKGIKHLKAEVVYGVLPDPAWVQRSERLLELTLLSLVGMDLETFRDGDAEAELDLADLRELTSLFNSD